MFERYTEPARRTLFFGRYEASQMGTPIIGTEHLLLGLFRERSGMAARLLQDIPRETIRTEIDRRIPRQPPISTSVEIPFSLESKKALQWSAEEADRLGDADIGTEHLLLGVLRDQRTVAGSILDRHGVRLEETRQRIIEFRQAEPMLAEEGVRRARTVLYSPDAVARLEEVRTLVTQLSLMPGETAEASDTLLRIHSALDELKGIFTGTSRPPS
jgi:ATP-dependent Clp protease ATP-binding subunit ClpC